jgi:formylglycine-generating enzyme required for sulfatase activity
MVRGVCMPATMVLFLFALLICPIDLVTGGSASPPANPSPGDKWVSPTDGREMIWIPPGQLMMGSPAGEPSRGTDEDQHSVQISQGFWMDTVEVTNAAYQKFVKANGKWQKGKVAESLANKYYLRDWNGNDFPAGKGEHPVTWVSWHSAKAYADWAGKRLPTEAEWEYACRAGKTSAFWWGDFHDGSKANNSGDTQPVGSPTRKNAWGLFDMSGNVWEWTLSRYLSYPYNPGDGRDKGVKEGENVPVVVRGGGWNSSNPKSLRSANRLSINPTICYGGYGFRCVQ